MLGATNYMLVKPADKHLKEQYTGMSILLKSRLKTHFLSLLNSDTTEAKIVTEI